MKFLLTILGFGLGLNLRAQSQYSLRSALQTARLNNPTLVNAKMDIAKAATDTITAQLRYNPTLNNQTLQLLQPTYFRHGTSWVDNHNRQVWWQLTKRIQMPHQRKFKVQYARQGVAEQQKFYTETERGVLVDVALKWLNIWRLHQQLAVLTIAQTNVDSLYKINKIRYDNQVITFLDLSRTGLLVEQYTLEARALQQQLKNEKNNLAYLMGQPKGAEIQISNFEDSLFNSTIALDTLFEFADKNRADMVAWRASIERAQTNIDLQKALATPAPEAGFIYNPQNSIQYAGIYITMELPFFSRNQGNISHAKLEKLQMEQAYTQAQQLLRVEVQAAYDMHKTQKDNLENYAKLLLQSQTILDGVRFAYLRGGTTLIDFLEAQRSWLSTQQNYYDIQQQYQESYINLLYATGIINQLAQ